jgi:hypothetical protein
MVRPSLFVCPIIRPTIDTRWQTVKILLRRDPEASSPTNNPEDPLVKSLLRLVQVGARRAPHIFPAFHAGKMAEYGTRDAGAIRDVRAARTG